MSPKGMNISKGKVHVSDPFRNSFRFEWYKNCLVLYQHLCLTAYFTLIKFVSGPNWQIAALVPNEAELKINMM